MLTGICLSRYPQIRGTLAKEHRAARKIYFFFPCPASASCLLARASSPLTGLSLVIYITKFEIFVLIQTQFLWENNALCFTRLLHTLLLIELFALMPNIQHSWSNPYPPPFQTIGVQKYWIQNMKSNQPNITVSKEPYTLIFRHAVLPLIHMRIPKISVAFQHAWQP